MKQSNSFKFFKEKTQEIFNFAVIVTVSVPSLKQAVNIYKKGLIGRLPDPDYFEPSVVYSITSNTIEQLENLDFDNSKIDLLKKLLDVPFYNSEFKKKIINIIGKDEYNKHRNILKKQSPSYLDNILDCTSNYQSKLASYLYFSTFSYFEAFIIDISKEIVENLPNIDSKSYVENYTPTTDNIGDKIKLDKDFDPRKQDRYKKYSAKLKSVGYLMPEEVLFSSLLDNFSNKINDLKANELPEHLEKILFFKMTEDERIRYHQIRANRNSIGHGTKTYNPNLTDVINANKFFKNLSKRIDQHVSFYFFKLKNYQV